MYSHTRWTYIHYIHTVSITADLVIWVGKNVPPLTLLAGVIRLLQFLAGLRGKSLPHFLDTNLPLFLWPFKTRVYPFNQYSLKQSLIITMYRYAAYQVSWLEGQLHYIYISTQIPYCGIPMYATSCPRMSSTRERPVPIRERESSVCGVSFSLPFSTLFLRSTLFVNSTTRCNPSMKQTQWIVLPLQDKQNSAHSVLVHINSLKSHIHAVLRGYNNTNLFLIVFLFVTVLPRDVTFFRTPLVNRFHSSCGKSVSSLPVV